MITDHAGHRRRCFLILFPLTLLALAARVDTLSAQVPARVATPYTLMDDENRMNLEFGAETPLRGNGPFTGYGYFFYTRPHFLDEDLYLRLVIPPGDNVVSTRAGQVAAMWNHGRYMETKARRQSTPLPLLTGQELADIATYLAGLGSGPPKRH
jgi:hypothetical protein